jgi:putative transcriptional regulator
MSRARKYKSELDEATHTSVAGMHRAGTVDEKTMRGFDASCLEVPPIAPQQIKKLRRRHRVSQPVFARYLGTSESTVEKWETGVKKPSGMARKLLSIVEKHGLKVLA